MFIIKKNVTLISYLLIVCVFDLDLIPSTAVPEFPYGLDDQHVDLGSPLTWVCNVIAVPRATFKWYRDNTPVVTDRTKGYTVSTSGGQL